MSDISFELAEVDHINYAGAEYRFEPPILVPPTELIDGKISVERAAAWVFFEGMEVVQPIQLEEVEAKASLSLRTASLKGNIHITDLVIVQLLEGRKDRKITRVVELN